jgi:hypothetical protein
LEVLTRHRAGLDALAAALLESETISGAEVARLVDSAERISDTILSSDDDATTNGHAQPGEAPEPAPVAEHR